MTFAGEIEKFKNWINRRLAWLDANMIGQETSSEEETPQLYTRIFPNPASEILFVESDEIISRITIYSLTGTMISDFSEVGDYKKTVDLSEFTPGMYIIRLNTESGKLFSSRFIKK